MKVLNLYSGLGGNRKLWKDCTVTSVEISEEIASVYHEQFPEDEIIISDAHEYLRSNYDQYDFIWSSPPCQSHSRMSRGGSNRSDRKFPDFKLYEEIIFLQYNFKGSWVVENVIPYYKPLIHPTKKVGRHYFWSSDYFECEEINFPGDFINLRNIEGSEILKKWLGIFYKGTLYYGSNHAPSQVLQNCVHPNIGFQIFQQLAKNEKHNCKQQTLEFV